MPGSPAERETTGAWTSGRLRTNSHEEDSRTRTGSELSWGSRVLGGWTPPFLSWSQASALRDRHTKVLCRCPTYNFTQDKGTCQLMYPRLSLPSPFHSSTKAVPKLYLPLANPTLVGAALCPLNLFSREFRLSSNYSQEDSGSYTYCSFERSMVGLVRDLCEGLDHSLGCPWLSGSRIIRRGSVALEHSPRFSLKNSSVSFNCFSWMQALISKSSDMLSPHPLLYLLWDLHRDTWGSGMATGFW